MNYTVSDTVGENKTVSSGDFDGNYTSFFPFTNSSSGDDFCGGTFQHINDSGTDKIEYEVPGKIVLYRKFRSTVVRKVQYDFGIKCHMERDVQFSDDDGYNVTAELVSTGAQDEKKGDFTFGATLELTDEAYTGTIDSQQTYTNDEDLYLKVTQDDNQDYFQFSVEECYATSGSSATASANDKDVFIEKQRLQIITLLRHIESKPWLSPSLTHPCRQLPFTSIVCLKCVLKRRLVNAPRKTQIPHAPKLFLI